MTAASEFHPWNLRLVPVCSMANTALQEPDSPLPVIFNLRFAKILRLEIIHMSYDMKKCGKRIQQFRIQCGYTQEEFAKTLNIDRSTLSRIESGTRSCSLDLLIQFSELFTISLDYLILGKNNPITFSVEEKMHLEKQIEGLIAQLEQFKSIL